MLVLEERSVYLAIEQLLRFVRARAHMRADDAKIVRSGNAQCNTEGSP